MVFQKSLEIIVALPEMRKIDAWSKHRCSRTPTDFQVVRYYLDDLGARMIFQKTLEIIVVLPEMRKLDAWSTHRCSRIPNALPVVRYYLDDLGA